VQSSVKFSACNTAASAAAAAAAVMTEAGADKLTWTNGPTDGRTRSLTGLSPSIALLPSSVCVTSRGRRRLSASVPLWVRGLVGGHGGAGNVTVNIAWHSLA